MAGGMSTGGEWWWLEEERGGVEKEGGCLLDKANQPSAWIGGELNSLSCIYIPCRGLAGLAELAGCPARVYGKRRSSGAVRLAGVAG